MSENNECTHDCSSCGADCPSKGGGAIEKEKLNPASEVRHVIGVVSGKGGVGKSIVTSMLAVEMRRRDFGVAVLDADITGPSAPKAFGAGADACVEVRDEVMLPYMTKTGIQLMSVNLLLGDETSPVVWRGPVIAGAVKQFWTDVIWNDVDSMFVDMPPGTGDVHHNSNNAAGPCFHDSGKSGEYGKAYEHSDPGTCGEYVICRMSRLRKAY